MYDYIVVGGGMSGLAAGIRLCISGKRVLILEKHNSLGGLNGYYYKNGLKYDVGLHAMTNFCKNGNYGPFTKICRQLRIPNNDFNLREQISSCIKFPSISLQFSNDFTLLKDDIFSKFPKEIDGFIKLVSDLTNLDATSLTDSAFVSTKEQLSDYIFDDTLANMILLPLLYYGSAHQDDIDWRQFAILFKAIYIEGFSRPLGGVRTVIHLLRGAYKSFGGELMVKSEVASFIIKNNAAVGVVLKSGEEILAKKIISTIGAIETLYLCNRPQLNDANSTLTFLETITTINAPAKANNLMDTIVFYNNSNSINYKTSAGLFDVDSGVICVPENYSEHESPNNTTIRTTHLSNFDAWNCLTKEDYNDSKSYVISASLDNAKKILNANFSGDIIGQDIFTPLTIARFTGHRNGAIYGSTKKYRDGNIGVNNLLICGTDQGFLGIVGAMLSGISIANLSVRAG